MDYEKITSKEDLDNRIKSYQKKYGCPLECFLATRVGRSSKTIQINMYGDYAVYNEIDDSEEIIPHAELMDSNIGKAIAAGRFYQYIWND